MMKTTMIEAVGGGECVAIVEVDGREKFSGDVVDTISRMERKIFPKHESIARSLHEEVKKKSNGLLCARSDGGEVIGYVMYSWISSLCASITKLAVKENHRKQGHGESLMKAAISKCRTRNIYRISLHVDPSRTAAMSLYSKLGFQIDTLIQCYYSPDRNAYRMFLEFTDRN
ncbi:putative N-acetyltransferase [Zostera marina]|uniref:Putative N-acetyltransferase n=1 Tax=Zostera marina TaxID=29655 RepID=A0A0K9NWX2_ZOSMR|nr:putative N-acetyltransferase [Zostera marina]